MNDKFSKHVFYAFSFIEKSLSYNFIEKKLLIIPREWQKMRVLDFHSMEKCFSYFFIQFFLFHEIV